MPLSSFLEERRAVFSTLGVYGQFEQIVFYVLTLVISVVIMVAVGHLSMRVLALVLLNEMNPLNQEVFQSVFGMIMTVLIALEFNHSILAVLERHDNIVQVRTVILIALLALVRKLAHPRRDKSWRDDLGGAGARRYLFSGRFIGSSEIRTRKGSSPPPELSRYRRCAKIVLSVLGSSQNLPKILR